MEIRNIMPYFGYATFHEYWLAASRRGYCYEKTTEEKAYKNMMNILNYTKPHICAAKWIRDERKRNPSFRFRSIWYFIVPEARKTIPKNLLAEVDAAMIL